MEFLQKESLDSLLTGLENGMIRATYLGEGMDRIAYYIESGKYAGYVLKMEKSVYSDYGFFIGDMEDDFSMGEAGDQTETEYLSFKTIYNNARPGEWEEITDVFCVPYVYDPENNAQIVDAVGEFKGPRSFYHTEEVAKELNTSVENIEKIVDTVRESSYALIDRAVYAGILIGGGHLALDKVATAVELFEMYTGSPVADLHYNNIGYCEETGNYRIIDAGIVGDW